MADILPFRFRWDEAKNESNRRKHGISFGEACRLFVSGVAYLEILDEYSEHELRLIAIGPILRGLVVVVWTEREETIRIISARLATKRERDLYHSHMEHHR
jgi:uncharacterized DUF497 family protein